MLLSHGFNVKDLPRTENVLFGNHSSQALPTGNALEDGGKNIQERQNTVYYVQHLSHIGVDEDTGLTD